MSNQDHLRLVGARKLDTQISVSGTQQAHIRAAGDELLDQHQVAGLSST